MKKEKPQRLSLLHSIWCVCDFVIQSRLMQTYALNHNTNMVRSHIGVLVHWIELKIIDHCFVSFITIFSLFVWIILLLILTHVPAPSRIDVSKRQWQITQLTNGPTLHTEWNEKFKKKESHSSSTSVYECQNIFQNTDTRRPKKRRKSVETKVNLFKQQNSTDLQYARRIRVHCSNAFDGTLFDWYYYYCLSLTVSLVARTGTWCIHDHATMSHVEEQISWKWLSINATISRRTFA